MGPAMVPERRRNENLPTESTKLSSVTGSDDRHLKIKTGLPLPNQNMIQKL